MNVIVDARGVSKEERDLLIGTAIRKADTGEIVVLADDEAASEDISEAAGKHGWVLKGQECKGDRYRVTLSPTFSP